MVTTTKPDPGASSAFPVDRLLEWYDEHGRHELPWRQTRDPYAVLVSEVMLQQTQVDRVIPYFETWTARWPDATSLAAANPADVIRAWSGLGYNRRALNLHRSAIVTRDEHGGTVPTALAALRTLPGVGPYTASAIASFAGEAPVSVVDTNIGRVFARVQAAVAGVRDVPPARLAKVADASLPATRTRDFNLALMDLGAMVCSARRPDCESCPVATSCGWLRAGQPESAVAPKAVPRFETTARFARGRIIDALRVRSPQDISALAEGLPTEHAARVHAYLSGLERDGLVQRDQERWALAGELTPGSNNIASPKL